ncbi:MAG TPA: methylmalonyl-CoA mutase family protein, partial [Caulobacteraceae bacterium]
APVALDAGFDGPQAADRLAVVAKGSPQALLAFHLDPLTAFAQAGASPAAMDEHLLTAANTAARHVPAFPRASLFLAAGRAAHEAGGSDAQELGFAAACAVAYLRAMEAAGLSLQQAFDGLVWGVALDAEYFAGIAKLRALRLIAGRLARACGVTTTTRVEARSSRRMLAAKDPWTNMLRLTAAGFAGAVGGADAVVLDPFTQAVGRSTPFARRQARNTQLILMEEAHLGRVEDPARGAWALDAHARARAEAAGLQFQAIEAEGGVLAALRAGAFADQVAAVRVQRDADLAEGRAQIVGVTKFADPEPRPASVQPWPPRPVPDWSGDACAPLAPISLTAAFEAAQ